MRNLKNEFLPKCDRCGIRKPLSERVEGVSFLPQDYDGSDLFAFNNQANLPIVTDSLKKKIVKNKITNVKFTEISKRSFG